MTDPPPLKRERRPWQDAARISFPHYQERKTPMPKGIGMSNIALPCTECKVTIPDPRVVQGDAP